MSAGRGGYNLDSRRIGRATLGDSAHSHPDKQEKEYEQKVQEVLTRLPKELWKFEDVFCKKGNSNYRSTVRTTWLYGSGKGRNYPKRNKRRVTRNEALEAE